MHETSGAVVAGVPPAKEKTARLLPIHLKQFRTVPFAMR
jgi:hypothetical protein